MLLAACSEKRGNGSLSIDMNSKADAGNVSVSTPDFGARVKMPTGIMRSGNFDIDGVKLYPKSAVTPFNLNVDGKTTGGNSARPNRKNELCRRGRCGHRDNLVQRPARSQIGHGDTDCDRLFGEDQRR